MGKSTDTTITAKHKSGVTIVLSFGITQLPMNIHQATASANALWLQSTPKLTATNSSTWDIDATWPMVKDEGSSAVPDWQRLDYTTMAAEDALAINSHKAGLNGCHMNHIRLHALHATTINQIVRLRPVASFTMEVNPRVNFLSKRGHRRLIPGLCSHIYI